MRYDFASQGDVPSSVALNLTRYHLAAAYAFLRNQVCFGIGARAVFVQMNELQSSGGAVISMFGAAPQIGMIVKPEDVQWRLGVTARAPVEAGPLDLGRISEVTEDGMTTRRAGRFILPDRFTQPWEVEIGIAHQLGPRPLNPAWIDPHEHEASIEKEIERKKAEERERWRAELANLPSDPAERELRLRRIRQEQEAAQARHERELADAKKALYETRRARYLNWPRERIMLLASLLMTGPSLDAVALEGFIDQRRELVGRRISFSPRFAVEAEPVANLLMFRSGVYLEPSRFTDGQTRHHFTFGGDLKLFAWDVFGLIDDQTWRISAFLDVAPRYQSFGVGIGAWR